MWEPSWYLTNPVGRKVVRRKVVSRKDMKLKRWIMQVNKQLYSRSYQSVISFFSDGKILSEDWRLLLRDRHNWLHGTRTSFPTLWKGIYCKHVQINKDVMRKKRRLNRMTLVVTINIWQQESDILSGVRWCDKRKWKQNEIQENPLK